MKKISNKIEKLFNTKKKRNMFAIILVAMMGVMGVTLAYFTTTSTFKNIFKTPPFNVTVYEIFESPDNWTPGMTVPKEVYATNNSNVDVAVRISYEEEWIAQDGTELSLEQEGNRAAIINLTNTEDWSQSGSYYYYINDLKPGETTSSFMESVTFNPEITGTYTCTTNEDGHDECTSTGTGFDGATYTLTITIEMIQADAKDTAWKENYLCPSPSTYPGEDLISTEVDSEGNYLYEDYTFVIDTENNTASLVEYTGNGGEDVDITIPKSINGVTITTIAKDAFRGRVYNTVTISPYIQTMTNAFYGSTINSVNTDYALGLTEISGFAYATIANDLIYACSPNALTVTQLSSLTASNITLKNLSSLQTIDECYGLSANSFTVEDSSVLSIKGFQTSSLAENISVLTLKNLPNLTTIGNLAFMYVGLDELNLVNLPSLKNIEAHAFYTNNLTSVTLEGLESLENIGESSFRDNPLNDGVVIKDLPYLKVIESLAFQGNSTVDMSSLTLENLPKLEEIEIYAFRDHGISELKLKDLESLKTIGDQAFVNSNLTKLSFEEMPNIERIESYAFSNNPITYIDFTAATKLSYFGSFQSTVKMDYIDLSGLQQDITFSNIYPQVDKIDLSDTKSNTLVANALQAANQTSNAFVDLSNSQITTLDFTTGGRIGTINLNGCDKLETINLMAQLFTEIDLDTLTSLSTLKIYYDTNLTKINFGSSANTITELEILNGNITELDLSSLTNLTTLNLMNNAHTKLKIPASVTTISSGMSSKEIECIEILGDSTRFDSDFEKIFNVTKESISSTCAF